IYQPTGAETDCYLKDLPLAKAMSDEVLLATTLNGAPLDERHGAPARLVVPGFYGTNSVKWLTEIQLAADRAQGYFTTTLYNDTVVTRDIIEKRPVWEVAPHSVIVAPGAGDRLLAGLQQLWGWAWSAYPVQTVEVSVDGGHSWDVAEVSPREDFCWQRFSFYWTPAALGQYTLLCRATDTSGFAQPKSGARNEVLKVNVVVESSAPG
ncbi:MAG: molybdopterin-dependent oxidoreductase, partial [Pseudomonadota bacterium]|nr:molybdopterin-dependent oxidoreductase [Pseudomonadota bacterium]